MCSGTAVAIDRTPTSIREALDDSCIGSDAPTAFADELSGIMRPPRLPTGPNVSAPIRIVVALNGFNKAERLMQAVRIGEGSRLHAAPKAGHQAATSLGHAVI
jgi:hypothetical protein